MSAASLIRQPPVTHITAQDYVILAPDGRLLKVDGEVFNALAMFLGLNRKHNGGCIEIQCRNGGVAGVEAKVRLK